MIWLLLPLTAVAAVMAVGAVNWRQFAGESAPAEQVLPAVPSAPVATPKDLPSLPVPPLQSEDWPEVEKGIKKAMAQCAPSFSPQLPLQLHNLDHQPPPPLVGQVECLLNWLKAQNCVKAVRAPLAEAEGKAALRLLTSLPAQVEIEVDFLAEEQEIQTRVLTLAVEVGEQFRFVALRRGARAGP